MGEKPRPLFAIGPGRYAPKLGDALEGEIDRLVFGEEPGHAFDSGDVMPVIGLRPAQQHIRIDENTHLCAITVNALPADRLIREGRCVGKTDDRLAPGSRAFRRRHEGGCASRKLCLKEALNVDRQRQALRLCLGEQARFDFGR
jgi:hypothetical protein